LLEKPTINPIFKSGLFLLPKFSSFPKNNFKFSIEVQICRDSPTKLGIKMDADEQEKNKKID